MTKTDKRKLVKRLYELANGGQASTSYAGDCLSALKSVAQINLLTIIQMQPHEVSTLAGFAAAYIETEL